MSAKPKPKNPMKACTFRGPPGFRKKIVDLTLKRKMTSGSKLLNALIAGAKRIDNLPLIKLKPNPRGGPYSCEGGFVESFTLRAGPETWLALSEAANVAGSTQNITLVSIVEYIYSQR